MSKLYNKGDTVFLYIKFLDENGNYSENVKNVKARILHEKFGDIYEDMEWTMMNQLSTTEYYLNYVIPYDSELGMYDIFYYGEINDKPATMIESFHVINNSEQYDNAIKVYGYITDGLNDIPLSGVTVSVQDSEKIYYTQSITKLNGYWEVFIYPGDYSFEFSKNDFETQTINIQLGDENNEIQFNNVTMESLISKQCGNGAYEVTDSYILKNGIALDGLLVEVFDVNDIKNSVASCITNNKGVWKVFVDPGFYFLKVKGKSMNNDFDRTFRLIVKDNGKYTIEDMDDNKAVISDILNNGTGSKEYKDTILDRNGNPIVDVQVNIYDNKNKMIAQCYTNVRGEYIFHLDEGEYKVDIYHPSFKEVSEFKITI